MFLELSRPLVLANLVNLIQANINNLNALPLSQVAWYCFGLVGILIGIWAFHGPARVLEREIAFHAKVNMQSDLISKVTELPMRWHKNHHSGQTIDQINRAVTSLSTFTEGSYLLLSLTLRFIGSVIMLIYLFPMVAFAVIGAIGLIVPIIILYDVKLIRQERELNLGYNRVASAVQDYLTNISTIISLRLEKLISKEVRDRTLLLFPTHRRNFITNELKWFSAGILIDLFQMGVLFTYLAYHIKGGKVIELGTLYALLEYLREVGGSFFNFTGQYASVVVASTRIRAAEHILKDHASARGTSTTLELPSAWRKIHLRNLSFSHPDVLPTRGPSLFATDVRLERGRSYAVVGESGSGKSTLLSVLRGILKGEAEEFSVDGVVLENGLRSVNAVTSLIPQDPEVFADSIEFNITLGVNATTEEIDSAILLSRFDQVLRRLPKGLKTDIAEKGVSLSGGERQRLALARGFFFAHKAESSVLLLDEPTSSVDATNELLIYQTLLRENRDKAILTSIHKFNLLHLFDEIWVFANGVFVERGTFNSLLKEQGHFAYLWSKYDDAAKGGENQWYERSSESAHYEN